MSAEALAKADARLVLSHVAQIPQIPQQAAVGFEPTDNGFANRPLRPLGYAASHKSILKLPAIRCFCNKNYTTLFDANHKKFSKRYKNILTYCGLKEILILSCLFKERGKDL